MQSGHTIVQYGLMALKTHVNNKTHEKLTQQNQIKNFFVKKNKANTETSMEKSQSYPSDSCKDVLQT